MHFSCRAAFADFPILGANRKANGLAFYFVSGIGTHLHRARSLIGFGFVAGAGDFLPKVTSHSARPVG